MNRSGAGGSAGRVLTVALLGWGLFGPIPGGAARAATPAGAAQHTAPAPAAGEGARALAIGPTGARRLLARSGFDATEGEVRAFASLTREAAVDRLIAGLRTEPVSALPSVSAQPFVPPRVFRELSVEARMAENVRERQLAIELRAWWLREMVVTDSPLTERLTLFWHNHFVSSQPKVRQGRYLLNQNLTLRRLAAGSFRELVHAMARDPAMVIYLDSATNRSGQPNENFARELMELFTLGEGSYSERDVQEAARAFTGYSIDPAAGTFVFRWAIHDSGEKLVFGQSGPYDGDAVIDLILARAEPSTLIVRKLWLEFVSDEPDESEVARLAATFRADDYALRPLLRALLLVDAAWDPANAGALVKSPVELVVGTVRRFGIDSPDYRPFALATAGMGQNLFSAPNVRGWPGGQAWINSSSLLARKRFLDRMVRVAEDGGAAMVSPQQLRLGGESFALRFDLDRWLGQVGDDSPPGLEQALLAVPPVGVIPGGPPASARVRAVLLDPAYQVK